MMSLNNSIIESFYFQECNEDKVILIDEFFHMLELRKLQNDFKSAFKEI